MFFYHDFGCQSTFLECILSDEYEDFILSELQVLHILLYIKIWMRVQRQDKKDPNKTREHIFLFVFFCLSNLCDQETVKNNKKHLWSSNSRENVMFLQEV